MNLKEGVIIGLITTVEGTSGVKHYNFTTGDGSFNPNATDSLLQDGTYKGIILTGPSTITLIVGESGIVYENVTRNDGTIGDKLIE